MLENDAVAAIIYKILVLLGGGGAVLVAVIAAIWSTCSAIFTSRIVERRKAELARELERTKADLGHDLERFKTYLSQETETHKLKLRKAEIRFNRLIDATGEFIQLHHRIRPHYAHPEMDWNDALEDVARRFGDIAGTLQSYMAKNG